MLVFLNGQFVSEAEAVVTGERPRLHVWRRMFETVRVVHGKPFRFAQHLERMMRGADFLKIKPTVHAEGTGKIRRTAR